MAPSGLYARLCHAFLVYCIFQSITGAMNTIKPPVSLDNSDNEHRLDYVQNVASQPDYEITQVSN